MPTSSAFGRHDGLFALGWLNDRGDLAQRPWRSPGSMTLAIRPPGGSITQASDTGCSTSATNDVCGIANDDRSGVVSVAVSIRRNSDGHYWDGLGFNSTTEVWKLATGTTAWRYSFARPADGSYRVRSRATDAAGNVQIPGTGNTFTIDTVA